MLGLPEKFAFPEAGIVGYRLGGEEPGLLLRLDATLLPAPPRSTPRVWLEVARCPRRRRPAAYPRNCPALPSDPNRLGSGDR